MAREEILSKAFNKDVLVPCSNCGIEVKARDLMRHENSDCEYRRIYCPREDCHELVQQRDMKDHLKFTCRSKMFFRRCWMVNRARERLNYPRPWGIEIPLFDDDISSDEEYSQNPTKSKPNNHGGGMTIQTCITNDSLSPSISPSSAPRSPTRIQLSPVQSPSRGPGSANGRPVSPLQFNE